MQRLRSKLFDAYFVLWTACFAPVLAILWMGGKPARPIRVFTRLWASGALWGLGRIVGLTHVERFRERIPATPCLVVANHQSEWETIAFLVLIPEVAIVAKQELLSIPIVGWFLRHSPMILIDRDRGGNAMRAMIEGGRAALAAGRSVLVFPEGGRVGTAAPVEFKRGIEILYGKLDTPVLPVALDSGRFWGAEQPFKRPGTITVTYLDPIPPGLPPAQFAREAERVMEGAVTRA